MTSEQGFSLQLIFWLKRLVISTVCLPILFSFGCSDTKALCSGIDCSGHGFCRLSPYNEPQCFCDPGYRIHDETSCVPENDPDPCQIDSDCNDNDICTLDSCDENQICQHQGKDNDSDGYIDATCPAGDDCDDDDFDVNPGGIEKSDNDQTCSDLLDNDCDGQTDNDDTDCDNVVSWEYRKQISVDNALVIGTASHNDFPVGIFIINDSDLRSISNGGHVYNDSGYDIVFRDFDGTTPLYHEMENYDPSTGTLVAWVRIPTLKHNENTVLFIYYGHSGIVAPQESPNDVWDIGYRGVWHLAENPDVDPFAYDSTSNTNNATIEPAASMDSNDHVTGKIGAGLDFDGTNDRLTTNYMHNSNLGTISYWLNFRTIFADPGGWGYGSYSGHNDLNDHRFYLGLYDVNNLYSGYGDTYDSFISAPSELQPGTWYMLTLSASGTTADVYLDGTLVDSYSYTFSGQSAVGLNIGNIGRPDYNVFFFDAILDEFRISDTNRSADWIKTSYNNQVAPASFYSVGAEQTAP